MAMCVQRRIPRLLYIISLCSRKVSKDSTSYRTLFNHTKERQRSEFRSLSYVDFGEEPMTFDEILMMKQLNEKIFSGDPLEPLIDPNRKRTDLFNKTYLMEIKERYHSVDKIKNWGGATIEKDKYYALTQSCGDKIPGYVNKFPCGSYYAWNLKKIKEPTWYEKMMPKTTNWDNTKVKKIVGDLKFEDATKLI